MSDDRDIDHDENALATCCECRLTIERNEPSEVIEFWNGRSAEVHGRCLDNFEDEGWLVACGLCSKWLHTNDSTAWSVDCNGDHLCPKCTKECEEPTE